MSVQLLEFRQKEKSGTVESALDHLYKLGREIARIRPDSKIMEYREHQDGSYMMHH